ncbi:Putative lipoprotein lprA precursor (plasmid) [Tsukamurella tyrosinosolvens]|uniref:Lipoprotein LprG n=1 Tax=Tsukamurella tyrosinosolvens TaxID=57704 RepID=A0A1H4UH58_TSUTY|nr:LppX_LprAFG lipoprotein [Tsukamurella tyrosinosolvens]KXO92916.1 hypothetical protein AXK58_13665 [Tsukamurella tyrosinosolvens]SEC68192.1 Protein of unknown function [Tsukamurella tyrosinosolvens]VEH94231.1 Putative lipoprotein lprA precursor [Tsukamurella tyrosinosolvens]
MNKTNALAPLTRIATGLGVVVLATTLVACGPDEATAAPAASASPSPVALPSESASPETSGAAAQASGADASSLIDEAAKSARILRSVRAEYSTTGIENLLAKSYAAEITTTPSVASRGTANLKIQGAYRQSDFRTIDGKLWIKGTDGKFVDAGPARGKFDPAVLLDPQRGLAALIASTESAKIDGGPAKLDGKDTVKVAGTLPTAAAAVLVPRESLGERDEVPVTLWFTPNKPNDLVQLIIKAGDSSITLKLSKGEPFTIAAG